ncbi:dTDP-4-dehydrorhamnose reductase [Pontibacter sp. JAM-7]|uniref:dTDP-4-dehydrorhamnose reductase n=1 Tax=Pontibacter sp. JAM-7 TaxID=3366581 RepID=UPI003AF9475B
MLKPVRVLVTGAGGQAGAALCRLLVEDPCFEAIPLMRAELDITQAAGIAEALSEHAPDYVVNCAGVTHFNQSGQQPDIFYAVNCEAVEHLAKACVAQKIPLLHLSSDAVFDSQYASGYAEDDAVAPQGVYGESVWQGEQRLRACLEQHIILRVSWLFSAHGANFLTATVRAAREEDTLQEMTSHVGCPTSAHDVARVITAMIKQLSSGAQAWGTYHYCGAEVISRYDFCKEILIAASEYESLRVEKLVPLNTADASAQDELPSSSVLLCKKLLNIFGIRQRPWRQELKAEMRALYQLGTSDS